MKSGTTFADIKRMLSTVYSAGLHGIDAFPVLVEVDFASQGLPGWHLVGLPETVVRESKDRVTASLRNAGFQLRYRKTTINLAPASRKKAGNYFDLPIAIGLLVAAEVLPPETIANCLFSGELLLSGDLHPVHGALSLARYAHAQNLTFVLPEENVAEVKLVKDLRYIPVRNLRDCVEHLLEQRTPRCVTEAPTFTPGLHPDMADVKGQYAARRALEIAAAGGHHLIFMGPPGSGKTMLARRLASILPPLHYDEAIATTQIYSAMGQLEDSQLINTRPFRAPHHSASAAGVVGGGPHVTGGEMSLAHNGVLFMDELPEFRRDVLETLRQPLETGVVSVSRAGHHMKFPARFQLIAACNPCRCGYFGHARQHCNCSMNSVHSYRAKLSGPLLDRIDLHVPVEPVSASELMVVAQAESSASIRKRVLAARRIQATRYRELPLRCNAQLRAQDTQDFCALTRQDQCELVSAIERHGLSARGYDRILRIARTIADLAGDAQIAAPHLNEALLYRCLEKPL